MCVYTNIPRVFAGDTEHLYHKPRPSSCAFRTYTGHHGAWSAAFANVWCVLLFVVGTGHCPCFSPYFHFASSGIGGLDDKDPWILEYEGAKSMADEIVASIQVYTHWNRAPVTQRKPIYANPSPHLQERNLKHPHGGPDASRITAAARRQLGMLGTGIGSLQARLEADHSM